MKTCILVFALICQYSLSAQDKTFVTIKAGESLMSALSLEDIFHYPNFTNSGDALREVNSTYIHFPLLVKFSSLRTGNIRPYLVGGVSATLNLSSNSKLIDDNLEQRFRVKAWTTNYELGFGIDLFSEYFIFSPSIRGVFGMNDELIRDKDPNSPWTSNIESLKTRAVFINFTFH